MLFNVRRRLGQIVLGKQIEFENMEPSRNKGVGLGMCMMMSAARAGAAQKTLSAKTGNSDQ
jgi:hypothetical protein